MTRRRSTLFALLPLLIAVSPLFVRLAARAARGPEPRSIRLVDGVSRPLRASTGGALVLIFTSAECPIANAYSPTLNALAGAYPADRVALVGVFVDPDLSDGALRDHAKEFALNFPVATDRRCRLAKEMGVSVTPEAAVLDDRGEVRYVGRIDDQWAARGKANAHPKAHELKDAIGALLAGKPIEKSRVAAVGCPLPQAPKPEKAPTYHGEVAEILNRRCVDCHRPGQVGPFALLTFNQARKRAADIAQVVESRQMPPWKPSPHFGGPFKNDRSMTPEEIETLIAWAEGGAPEGEPKAEAVAPPPKSNAEWALGTPDLVIEMPEAYDVPASGADIYRCFVVPTSLPKGVYVAAVEFKPGNPTVVHHVISYVDTQGKARELDRAEAGPGYTCFSGPMFDVHGDLGGWAPGNEPGFLPEGIGRSLPKGSDVVLQMHYHPSGKPETDRTKIGLYFCKTPTKQVLHWASAAHMKMVLPKDQPRVEIRAQLKAPVDMDAYAVSPHMHLLGKDMTIVLTEPDGTTRPLVRIDDWDFQWQNTYYFREPIRIKKGTTLDVVAHYDNSKDNPRNPNNPPIEVRWGEATTDEMCIGFLAVTKAGQDLTKPGEVDDLGKILARTYREMWREYEESQKSRSGR